MCCAGSEGNKTNKTTVKTTKKKQIDHKET